MRTRFTFSVVLAVAVAAIGFASACGGGSRSPETPSTLYVNATSGADDNPGTEAEPLRTVTRALELLTFRSGTVRVAPGTYDAVHGESFPLYVHNDVALIGDAPNRGQGARWTSITGSAQVSDLPAGNPGTVLLGEGASITGFVVGAGHFEGHNLSILLNESAQVVSCTLPGWRTPATVPADGTAGVVILPGQRSCQVRDCVAEGHYQGILLGWGSNHLLEANVIRDNRTGVRIHMVVAPSGADLGGGTEGSLGRNVIAGNDLNLDILGDTHVSARDCTWDHAPPVICTWPDTCPGDMDIYLRGKPAATVDVTGASAVTP